MTNKTGESSEDKDIMLGKLKEIFTSYGPLIIKKIEDDEVLLSDPKIQKLLDQLKYIEGELNPENSIDVQKIINGVKGSVIQSSVNDDIRQKGIEAARRRIKEENKTR